MRHFLVLAVVAALLGGAYLALAPKTAAIEGRVLLRALDGTEMPGGGAKVACYPAVKVDEALRQLRDTLEESQAANQLELQAARSAWSQATARRDDAARVLRVAEGANSADLEICRARHREAAADAEDALHHLELLQAGVGEATDPARFVGGLTEAVFDGKADADGSFRAEVPGDTDVFLAVILGGSRKGESAAVWLRRGAFENGEEISFSNETILTAGQLLQMARTQKKPESPKTSTD